MGLPGDPSATGVVHARRQLLVMAAAIRRDSRPASRSIPDGETNWPQKYRPGNDVAPPETSGRPSSSHTAFHSGRKSSRAGR